MLTQFELDAQRHELNYELQCRQQMALRQYSEEKDKIYRERNGVKADYRATKRLLEQSLDNVKKERLELKARGLECYAPEMQDSYQKERELMRDLADAKENFNDALDKFCERARYQWLAYTELCMLNKKWYAEQLRQMLTEAEAA